MQRIIITEVDNTSNVESLSSYDVVYVPGFSNNGASPSFDKGATLFRTPTLVTSKYDFLRLFGNGGLDDCPVFPADQPYPIATESKVGFPSYAIPGYIPPTDPTVVSGVNNMTYEGVASEEETISKVIEAGYYEHETVDSSWSPAEGTIYYLATTSSEESNVLITMSALSQSAATPVQEELTLIQPLTEEFQSGVTLVNPFEGIVAGSIHALDADGVEVSDNETTAWTASDAGVITEGAYVSGKDATDVAKIQYDYYTGNVTYDYSNLLIFTSSTSPAANNWMIMYEGQYIYTDDTYIGFNTSGATNTTVKEYLIRTTEEAIMFKGPGEGTSGDPDPGYRYALYLLSLGIPVYYEQMNSGFEAIDMNDPANASLSPVANDWFVEINGNYYRTDDEEVKEGVTYYKGADISITSMYKGLEYRFGGYNTEGGNPSDYSFDSMGDYSVKYITSGGYPTFEYGPLVVDPDTGVSYGSSPLAENMVRLASTRQDALALIDHTNNPNRTIYASDRYSVITRIRSEFSSITTEVGSFGAMFTPWYTCTHTAITGGSERRYGNSEVSSIMPASLAFLSALSQQLKNYNPWLAVSGVSRGGVPYCGGLHTNFTLTNNVADSYQIIPGDVESLGSASISINPITYIRNYGYCIWGNRTLRNNSNGTKATSFLNIRNTVSDIKKRLYEASQRLLFEQNTDILWVNFKGLVSPILESMVSNYILSDYSIIKYNVDPETGLAVPSYKVLAAVRIVPVNSVEVFELQVQLENSEVTIAEVQ